MKSKKFINCACCQKSFYPRRSSTKYCSRHCQSKDLFQRGISGRKKKSGKMLVCPICKESFYVAPYRFKKYNPTYCSRSCLAKDKLIQYVKIYGFKKSGKPHHTYKYIIVNGKKIREHRHIMQEHLGRKLERLEHVHHINDDSSDNRLENLIVLSNSEHQKIEVINRLNPKV